MTLMWVGERRYERFSRSRDPLGEDEFREPHRTFRSSISPQHQIFEENPTRTHIIMVPPPHIYPRDPASKSTRPAILRRLR